MQSQRKIDEFHLKIRCTTIEIEQTSKLSNYYKGDNFKENIENTRHSLTQVLNTSKSAYRDEQIGKTGVERVLNTLRNSLEEKKRQVEYLKNLKVTRIPAQFLASEKLAMNKRKFSPTKSQRVLNLKSKRSSSASK